MLALGYRPFFESPRCLTNATPTPNERYADQPNCTNHQHKARPASQPAGRMLRRCDASRVLARCTSRASGCHPLRSLRLERNESSRRPRIVLVLLFWIFWREHEPRVPWHRCGAERCLCTWPFPPAPSIERPGGVGGRRAYRRVSRRRFVSSSRISPGPAFSASHKASSNPVSIV